MSVPEQNQRDMEDGFEEREGEIVVLESLDSEEESFTTADQMSNGESSDAQDYSDAEEDAPLPRDHSYLPSSHPLMVEDDNNLPKRPRSESTTNNESPFVELAILELNGVVLFPGSTIPVKLRDRRLIQYLGRQIDLCRVVPHIQPVVRLGILTYEPPKRRRSSASRRTISEQRLRTSWMRRNMSLQDEFSLDDEESNNNNNNTQGGAKHPFVGRIGTIATIKSTHERTENQTINSLSSSQVWHRYEEGSELVFTAVGTR